MKDIGKMLVQLSVSCMQILDSVQVFSHETLINFAYPHLKVHPLLT
jgi:hypothetical protein